MANIQKEKKRFIVFNGIGMIQAANGTAMADADLDTRHNCKFEITDVVQTETVYDCAGEDVFSEDVESQYKLLTVTYTSVTPQIVALWLAYLLSAAAEPVTVSSQEKHILTRSADDALVPFSFIEGFEGDSTPAQKYKDFKVASLAFTFNRRKNVGLVVTAYGNFNTEDVGGGWTLPVCANLPALKGRNCKLLINSVAQTSKLWQGGFTLDNVVPTGDDVFPFDSVDIDDFERGDKPVYPMTAQVEGSKGDTLYTNALARAKQSVVWQLGADGSDNVVITAPSTYLSLASPSTVFVGEISHTAINLAMNPHKDATLGTPIKAEFFGTQQDAFLLDTAP